MRSMKILVSCPPMLGMLQDFLPEFAARNWQCEAPPLVQVLTACGSDLSRANVMKQAASLSHAKVPVLLEGIDITTSATDFRPIQQMQLRRFNGTNFETFGNGLAATQVLGVKGEVIR